MRRRRQPSEMEPGGTTKKVTAIAPPVWNPVKTFVMLYVVLSAVYMMRTAVPASIPRILREYPDLGLGFVGRLSTYFSLSYSIGKLTGGFVSDLTAPQTLLIGCLFASIVGIISFELNNGYPWAQYFSYSCIGYVQGLVWIPASKLLTDWWEESDRPVLWGVLSSAQTLGSMVVPLLVAQTLLRESDLPGGATFMLVAAFIATIPLGVGPLFLQRPVEPLAPVTTLGAEGAATPETSFVNRYRHRMKILFQKHSFWILSVATATIAFSRESSSDYVVLRGIAVDGMTESQAGYLRVAWQFGACVSSLASGLICRRLFGNRQALACAVFMGGAALIHWDAVIDVIFAGSYWARLSQNWLKGFFFFLPTVFSTLLVTALLGSELMVLGAAIGIVGVFAGVGGSLSGLISPHFLAGPDGWQHHHALVSMTAATAAGIFFLLDQDALGSGINSRKSSVVIVPLEETSPPSPPPSPALSHSTTNLSEIFRSVGKLEQQDEIRRQQVAH